MPRFQSVITTKEGELCIKTPTLHVSSNQVVYKGTPFKFDEGFTLNHPIDRDIDLQGEDVLIDGKHWSEYLTPDDKEKYSEFELRNIKQSARENMSLFLVFVLVSLVVTFFLALTLFI